MKIKIVFWIVFFILFFLAVIYLLLVPIILYIDTTTNQYYIQLLGLAKASIQGDKEELICIRLKVFFLNFSLYPLRKSNSENKKQKKHS
ncbi:hypothetical protein [Maribacter halichondriae]|uniref:hypothetical protein n=1 Tax=Maribacter halichondriae TaxID=2980554 RepID=UPI0023590076|nr:hypothetical protein [Maribacter sp. Hal144]